MGKTVNARILQLETPNPSRHNDHCDIITIRRNYVTQPADSPDRECDVGAKNSVTRDFITGAVRFKHW